MILELKKFESFPVHIVLNEDTTCEITEVDSISSLDKTMLELDIQKSADEYYCQGALTADVTLECARCLKHFKETLMNGTDFIAGPAKPESQKEIDDEDHVYYDHELRADLWEIIRQTVILAVSLKPLCSEDCRGLCPQCGTNLNQKKCKCTVSKVDPRLEPLKKLLEPQNRKGL